jgi:hypothetical protein
LNLVAVVARDLIIATRIGEAAIAAGHDVTRVDQPADLPPPGSVALVFVDWGGRDDDWAQQIREWKAEVRSGSGPRVVVFGPHADLAAHSSARDAGISPMIARSKLVLGLGSWLTRLDMSAGVGD